jgi:DHA2 family methylenomycin A resistance protein-like MFS transporter
VVVVSPYAGRLAARYGFRIVVTVGLALAGLGLLALGFVHADTGYGNVWWRLAVVGIGFALTMSPLTGAVTLVAAVCTGRWLAKSNPTEVSNSRPGN